MPVETETVNGNPSQDQKSDVTNGTEVQDNGQPVEPQEIPEQVDICALKAKVAAENDTIESAACPLTPEIPKLEPEDVVNDPVDNVSTQPQNGNDVVPVEDETPVFEAEPVSEPLETPVESEQEPIQDAVASVEEPPQPEPEPVIETQPEIAPVDIQPRVIETESTPKTEVPLTNGQSRDEDVPKSPEPEPELESLDKPKVLNGTIANELKTEDYKLPEVEEVKKHFEHAERVPQNDAPQPPRKGALATNLDVENVKKSYEDVRRDGSDTQWAVYKYDGSKLGTSATGTDFPQFQNQFGDEERAFGYIRVQTGDEMSKRAKFLFVTWVGPSVSVLKRAKMSTDKALIKGIVSNFAVELQTENAADINLENFENELAKAGGAHYGTGVRG